MVNNYAQTIEEARRAREAEEARRRAEAAAKAAAEQAEAQRRIQEAAQAAQKAQQEAAQRAAAAAEAERVRKAAEDARAVAQDIIQKAAQQAQIQQQQKAAAEAKAVAQEIIQKAAQQAQAEQNAKREAAAAAERAANETKAAAQEIIQKAAQRAQEAGQRGMAEDQQRLQVKQTQPIVTKTEDSPYNQAQQELISQFKRANQIPDLPEIPINQPVSVNQEPKDDTLVQIGTNFSPNQVQAGAIAEYAREHRITTSETMRLMDLARENPDHPDFKNLPEKDKRALQSYKMQMGIEYINKSALDAIEKDNPRLAEVLKKQGSTAYGSIIEAKQKEFEEAIGSDKYLYNVYKTQGIEAYHEAADKRYKDLDAIYQRSESAFREKLQKEDKYLYDVYINRGADAYNAALKYRKEALEGIYRRNYITINDSMMLKKDWEKLDPKYQNIALDRGFDAMDKAIQADIDKFNKAMKQLAPYGSNPKLKAKIKEDNNINAVSNTTTQEKKPILLSDVTGKVFGTAPENVTDYDIVKFLKENKENGEQVLRDAGFAEDSIKTAKEYAKLNFAQKAWRGMTPWDEFKGEKASIVGGLTMAAELIVPGVYTGRHWNELSAAEKGFNIVLDIVTLLPFATAGAVGAKAVGTSSRALRMAAAGKAVFREVISQAKAPVTAVIHPLATAKTTVREVRSLIENIAHPRRLPEVVITTTNGLAMLKVSEATTPAQAIAIRDQLTQLALRGERPVVLVDGKAIELTRSPLTKELGGGLSHSTPDVEVLWNEGGRVKGKAGFASDEQGLFLATEPAPEFTGGSAFGKGVIPLAPEAVDAAYDVSKFRVSELVKVDKAPVRPLDFANAKNVPADLAPMIQEYVRDNKGVLYGSMNEYTKIKKARQPNDLDLVFDNQDKAIKDIIDICERAGYQTRRAPHAIEIFNKGEWKQLADIAQTETHRGMLPEGLSQKVLTKINGIYTETMGEQYLRQSYGAVSKTAKAPERAERVNLAAAEVKKMLKKAGAEKRLPGIMVFSPETSEKSVRSGKLYHTDPKVEPFEKAAEMERKFVVGADIPEPKQKLYTRYGARSERIEIWLEKPLTAGQIYKLKAQGLIEWIKSPFKPAIKISEIGEKTAGITGRQMSKLSNILERSGNTRQAKYLMRVEEIARSTRQAPPIASRFGKRVSREEIDRAVRELRAERLNRPERPARDIPERLNSRTGRTERRRVEYDPMRPARTPPGKEPTRLKGIVPRSNRKSPEIDARRPRIPNISDQPDQPRPPSPPDTDNPRIPPIPPPDNPEPRRPPPPPPPPPRFPPRVPPPAPPKEPPDTPPKNADEKTKRDYIRSCQTVYAHRHGELNGKDIWWVQVKKTAEAPWQNIVINGDPPAGAFIRRGLKSAKQTMQKVRGPDEDMKARIDTGAVDTIITAEDKKIDIEFVPDEDLKKRAADVHEKLLAHARRVGAPAAMEGSSGAAPPRSRLFQNREKAGSGSSSTASTGFKSYRQGKMFVTPMPGGVKAYSRRSLSRRSRKR